MQRRRFWARLVTRLSSFEGRSSLRTWIYRIVVNHVLNMRRGRLEDPLIDFRRYGEELERYLTSIRPTPKARRLTGICS